MPPSRPTAPDNRLFNALAWLAALALAVAGRHIALANTDVSWLLTLDEKWLDGARPYVDIVETNPPMSLYLYMPVVLLGRWTSIAPDRAVVVTETPRESTCANRPRRLAPRTLS